MLQDRIASLLVEQVNKELFSAYLYLDMANYYAGEGLDGFSNWFYVQAQEEMDHAMLLRGYLLNNDAPVPLLPIGAPEERYADFSVPLTRSLAHERTITASIDALYAAASEAKDFRTLEFLSWFVKEQGEEEKNASALITKYGLFGGDAKGLYQLDQALAARAYVAPSLALD